MKTTTLEQPTTNNIRYSTELKGIRGEDWVIEIALNDECKNGHNDFSITGYRYTTGKPRIDKYCQGGGAMGDAIAAKYPQFKIFNDLHLCDAKGAPMYAQGNGFYHLKNSSKETVLSYLRITEAEYEALFIAEDQEYFTYILDNCLHIPARWQKEAIQAIKLLEGMTGLKFKDDSTRSQFTPLSEEVTNDIIFKINNGYYFPENIENRREQRLADAKQKTISGLKAHRDKTIGKANDEYNVKIGILNAGLPIDNLIYYNHTNKAVFNWKDYDKKITQEQFNNFILEVDYTKLPAGITFEFGEKK